MMCRSPRRRAKRPTCATSSRTTGRTNERTFAPWLRTGLTRAADGIAVAHPVPEPARDSWMALLLGAAFVLRGVAVIACGARQIARVAAALGRVSGWRSPADGARPVAPGGAAG